eukprot:GHVT01100888.1.p1 GENE.GHVT01100888.1~~GHVT01100888.1.p1  ORF type:complete len:1271 (+),score=209.04 GHVT01100888.1:787-4599(+)
MTLPAPSAKLAVAVAPGSASEEAAGGSAVPGKIRAISPATPSSPLKSRGPNIQKKLKKLKRANPGRLTPKPAFTGVSGCGSPEDQIRPSGPAPTTTSPSSTAVDAPVSLQHCGSSLKRGGSSKGGVNGGGVGVRGVSYSHRDKAWRAWWVQPGRLGKAVRYYKSFAVTTYRSNREAHQCAVQMRRQAEEWGYAASRDANGKNVPSNSYSFRPRKYNRKVNGKTARNKNRSTTNIHGTNHNSNNDSNYSSSGSFGATPQSAEAQQTLQRQHFGKRKRKSMNQIPTDGEQSKRGSSSSTTTNHELQLNRYPPPNQQHTSDQIQNPKETRNSNDDSEFCSRAAESATSGNNDNGPSTNSNSLSLKALHNCKFADLHYMPPEIPPLGAAAALGVCTPEPLQEEDHRTSQSPTSASACALLDSFLQLVYPPTPPLTVASMAAHDAPSLVSQNRLNSHSANCDAMRRQEIGLTRSLHEPSQQTVRTTGSGAETDNDTAPHFAAGDSMASDKARAQPNTAEASTPTSAASTSSASPSNGVTSSVQASGRERPKRPSSRHAGPEPQRRRKSSSPGERSETGDRMDASPTPFRPSTAATAALKLTLPAPALVAAASAAEHNQLASGDACHYADLQPGAGCSAPLAALTAPGRPLDRVDGDDATTLLSATTDSFSHNTQARKKVAQTTVADTCKDKHTTRGPQLEAVYKREKAGETPRALTRRKPEATGYAVQSSDYHSQTAGGEYADLKLAQQSGKPVSPLARYYSVDTMTTHAEPEPLPSTAADYSAPAFAQGPFETPRDIEEPAAPPSIALHQVRHASRNAATGPALSATAASPTGSTAAVTTTAAVASASGCRTFSENGINDSNAPEGANGPGSEVSQTIQKDDFSIADGCDAWIESAVTEVLKQLTGTAAGDSAASAVPPLTEQDKCGSVGPSEPSEQSLSAWDIPEWIDRIIQGMEQEGPSASTLSETSSQLIGNPTDQTNTSSSTATPPQAHCGKTEERRKQASGSSKASANKPPSPWGGSQVDVQQFIETWGDGTDASRFPSGLKYDSETKSFRVHHRTMDVLKRRRAHTRSFRVASFSCLRNAYRCAVRFTLNSVQAYEEALASALPVCNTTIKAEPTQTAGRAGPELVQQWENFPVHSKKVRTSNHESQAYAEQHSGDLTRQSTTTGDEPLKDHNNRFKVEATGRLSKFDDASSLKADRPPPCALAQLVQKEMQRRAEEQSLPLPVPLMPAASLLGPFKANPETVKASTTTLANKVAGKLKSRRQKPLNI